MIFIPSNLEAELGNIWALSYDPGCLLFQAHHVLFHTPSSPSPRPVRLHSGVWWATWLCRSHVSSLVSSVSQSVHNPAYPVPWSLGLP